MKSLILLLINEIRNDFVDDVYKKYMADLLRVVAMCKKISDDGNSWSDIYEATIGVNRVEYTPAQSIIADTLLKHGVKFASAEEAKKTLGDRADEFI